MTSKVLTIGALANDLHERRVEAVTAACERLGVLFDFAKPAPAPASAPATSATGLLRALASAGRLAVSTDDEHAGPWTVAYTPSPKALAAVAKGSTSSWGARLDAKQQKALRRAPGAVFRLPFADPVTGATSGDALATFTTDWSPFTAACAVAVHPDHEALAGTELRRRPYFSGRFVRHPLHGDLLPVWVADWVKPEFGTGAVIVNPAHSAADLEFALTTGLPVRFGLGPHEPGADPASWLTPPIIRTGQVIRAGRHDGRSHEEAFDAYLSDLLESGHADRAESFSLGRVPLAVFTADSAGDLHWSPALRARSLIERDAKVPMVSASMQGTSLLVAAAEFAAGAPVIVCSTDAVGTDLLWLRLLMLDLDVHRPPALVVPVARVGSAQTVDPQWMDGSLLVSGPPHETVSVKAQMGEQIGRIAKDHAAAVAGSVESDDTPSQSQVAGQVAAALAAADFAAAFKAVGPTAKTIRRGGTIDESERAAFLIALFVVLGLPLPEGVSVDRLQVAITS
ncbi:class I tRNA ligase family protein [Micromonospora craniellae]|uniref:class I tRNA ligase family protein n=1 Tax=Micromonospora craniellae TaxID=2294034 RepID=UPI00168B120F|nr:class I tRNA ligase family protein [Micromonospora craniellae]QOC93198.1 class I tRNA ligase family protein [Micromonospora craniellae]